MIIVHVFFAIVYGSLALLATALFTPDYDEVLAQARAEVKQEHALAMDQIAADMAINFELHAQALHELEVQRKANRRLIEAIQECQTL